MEKVFAGVIGTMIVAIILYALILWGLDNKEFFMGVLG